MDPWGSFLDMWKWSDGVISDSGVGISEGVEEASGKREQRRDWEGRIWRRVE